MSCTFEIRIDFDDVERALGALAPEAWALELFGRDRLASSGGTAPPARDPKAGRGVVLALFEDDDLARVRTLVPFARDVRALGAKVPAAWVEWKEQLRAIQVGPLWIANERSAPCPFGQYQLQLITKDAFGSGLHETTLLCLSRILELSPIKGAILDVGTGSGVLALAALSLGAERAVATEIDPLSRDAALKNAQQNNLADRFRIDASVPDAPFPVVVANIIAPVLLELAPAIARAVEERGVLIISGLRDHEVDRVAVGYQALGLVRGMRRKRGEWNRLELVRT